MRARLPTRLSDRSVRRARLIFGLVEVLVGAPSTAAAGCRGADAGKEEESPLADDTEEKESLNACGEVSVVRRRICLP